MPKRIIFYFMAVLLVLGPVRIQAEPAQWETESEQIDPQPTPRSAEDRGIQRSC